MRLLVVLVRMSAADVEKGGGGKMARVLGLRYTTAPRVHASLGREAFYPRVSMIDHDNPKSVFVT